jgi:hypothetical protein
MSRSIIAATVRTTGLAIVAIIGVAVTSPSMAGDHLAQAGAKDVTTGSNNTNSNNTNSNNTNSNNTNSNNPTVNNYYAPVTQVFQETSVPLETLRSILKSMGEKELAEASPAKIEQLLRAKAEAFLSLEQKLQQTLGILESGRANEYSLLAQELRFLKSDDPEVQHLRDAARKALREGRLQDADELLRQARVRVHAAGETVYSTWQASRKREAELASEQASAARLQVNPTAYRKAADLFGEAARLVATDDVYEVREYQFQQASVLDDLGDEFGDNNALGKPSRCMDKSSPALTAPQRTCLIGRRSRTTLGMPFEYLESGEAIRHVAMKQLPPIARRSQSLRQAAFPSMWR